MRYAKVSATLLAGTLAYWSLGASLGSQPADGTTAQPGVWQHHQSTISYFGITSLYTCDGLEDKVRALLTYLGARADLTVQATGCPEGPNRPSNSAWISIDFYSLAPAAAGVSETVEASWRSLTISPNRPTWMGAGECELMEQMKAVVLKDFSLRSVDYRARCFPHDVGLDDYAVKGEILRPVTAKAG